MNKRIGILCSSNSSGGLELNTARLATWLKERGWQVIIYGLKNSPLASMAQGDHIPFNSIKLPKKFLDIPGALSLSKKLKSDQIHILLVCTNRDLSIATWTKLFSGKNFRLLYQQHMQVGIKKKDIIHTLRYAAIDTWLTPAKYLAEEVKEKTRLDARKIRVVPLGIETKRFTPSPYSKEETRKTLQLPENKIILGIIGRLDPQKGQHLVIEALNKLRKHEDVHLLIMGDKTQGEHADYENELHRLSEKYKLIHKIHFRPFNEKVQIAFAAIDIFIMASNNETYGMVTIEAMASGVPVIGTNAGGTKEILNQGKFGLLFAPGNSDELAEKINWALNNPSPLKAITLSGQKHVLENYSHTRECELIEYLLIN